MAAYDAERFICQALQSVLAQTYTGLELLVCDDGCTDRTADLVREVTRQDGRVRLLQSEENRGGYGAMNRGATAARGEFIAFYHADDVYDPTIIAREVEFLDRHTEVGAVFTLDRFLDEAGREFDRLRLPGDLQGTETFDLRSLTDAMLRHRNTFLRTETVMFRAAAFRAMRGFDQVRYGIQADVDMWLRLPQSGFAVGLIHEYLAGYRHHPAQWSGAYGRLRTDRELYFDIVDRHLSQPGVRPMASPEALTRHQVWRVWDEAECAANLLVLGDRRRAVALLRTSAVRPLFRSWPARVARVLALRALVATAAALGGGPLLRRLVYWARFRRLPPARLPGAQPRAAQRLGTREVAPIGATGGSAHPRVPLRVFLDPFSYHFYGNAMFDPQSKMNRNDCLRPWRRLRDRVRQAGADIVTADYLADEALHTAANVYVSFGVIDRYRGLASRPDLLLTSFYLFEVMLLAPQMYGAVADLIKRFRTVYSWSDAQTLTPYVGGTLPIRTFRIPMPRERPIEPLWSNPTRAGSVLISGNRREVLPDGELYTERLRTLKDFVAAGEPIDLWGTGWERGLAHREREFGEAVRQAYRGPTADKYETMSRYRFAICYENMVLRGWITEKLFDCLVTGTIPVYLGAPEIGDLVPRDCFIDRRDFATAGELREFLRRLAPDEVERYRLAGREFLGSAAAREFGIEAFADRLMADIGQHLAERGIDRPWE